MYLVDNAIILVDRYKLIRFWLAIIAVIILTIMKGSSEKDIQDAKIIRIRFSHH